MSRFFWGMTGCVLLVTAGCAGLRTKSEFRYGAVRAETDNVVAIANYDGIHFFRLSDRKLERTIPPGMNLWAATPDGNSVVLSGAGPTTWVLNRMIGSVQLVGAFGDVVSGTAFSTNGRVLGTRIGDDAGPWRWYSIDTLAAVPEPEQRVSGITEIQGFIDVQQRFASRCRSGQRTVELKQDLDHLQVSVNGGAALQVFIRRGFEIGFGTRCFFGRAHGFTTDCRYLLFHDDGALWLADIDAQRVERFVTDGELRAILPGVAAQNAPAVEAKPTADNR